MKKVTLYICMFISILQATECTYVGTLNQTFLMKEQSSQNKILNSLNNLGKCGWLIKGTSLLVTVNIMRDNNIYIQGSDNSYNDSYTRWSEELYNKITKEISSEMYYANLKFIDLETVRNLEENKHSTDKESRDKALTKYPIQIHIDIALDKYNKHSNLHYGTLDIVISKYDQWEDFPMNHATKYTYETAIAGYVDDNKIMQKNILLPIKYFVGNTLKNQYIAYKNITKKHEYTLTSTYNWPGYMKDRLKYIGTALDTYADKLNVKIKYEPIPDYYLKQIAKKIRNDKEIITRELMQLYRKLYPYGANFFYEDLTKEQKVLIDNALIRVQELKKEMGLT